MKGPVNLFYRPKLKKIIGVFALLAQADAHQNQLRATLRRGLPLNVFNEPVCH
ncbi:replication protein RepA [Salmonella enterica subsp. enterica]|uniref:Replication protein RepA n=1 Tax=Salmonella enterica subsp. enterica serovar Kisarawe TaxID=2517242 RepID=A0A5X8YS85_SALET|nr:replication protein RepA [Salmonella enterica]EBH9883884.1 replication protein RepA [Salmonella enterica subsp. enterica serovar Kisarawe]EBS0228782.1 replication protein RepA [Salmonella enterica subsp. enterica serovar Schwarzengrund]EDS6473868.1 replication protein RepA [Salmonella enterica subsp. enterica]EAT8300539.1 replication protein RepA [Salmonella enterica]